MAIVEYKKIDIPKNKKSAETQEKKSGSVPTTRWVDSYVSLLLGALVVILAAALGYFYVKLHQPQSPRQDILSTAKIVRDIKLTITPTTNVQGFPVSSTQITPTAKNIPSNRPKVTPTTSVTPTHNSIQQNQNQRTYVVQKNDDLWSIAVKEYGSGYNWISIAHANNLANPGMIFSGDALVIPSVTPIIAQSNHGASQSATSSLAASSPTVTISPTPIVTITGTTHTVKKGDTLWSIAVQTYGNGYKWVYIAKANNLANPGLIHAGNVLQIPRPQTL